MNPTSSPIEYMSGTGAGFMGLSSEVGTGDGVSNVDAGFGADVTTNADGSATVGFNVPIVDTLPTANLPTTTGSGPLVYLKAGSVGLYLYDPSSGSWIGPI